MRRIALPQSWSDRALVIADVESPERWLSAEEVAVANAFRLPKRRQEWMLSRIAAKELARRRELVDLSVLIRSATLSLSHSGGYGGAAIDLDPIGIDIEVPRTIAPSAAHLFLTEEETRAMERCSIDNALLHFWCAKEALWKQQGGTIPTLKQVPLELKAETATGLRFDAVETYAGEVFVALTIPIFNG